MNIKNYKEGTILSIVSFLDSEKMGDIGYIKSVSICKDLESIEATFEEHESYKRQEFFIVNCFNPINEEIFNNEFIFDKKEVCKGDKIYVVVVAPVDDLGESIIGIFTEKPDKDTFYETYVNHWNNCFDDEYEHIDNDGAYISKIIEIEVS